MASWSGTGLDASFSCAAVAAWAAASNAAAVSGDVGVARPVAGLGMLMIDGRVNRFGTRPRPRGTRLGSDGSEAAASKNLEKTSTDCGGAPASR